MSDGKKLLLACLEHPDDYGRRRIFADWLQENRKWSEECCQFLYRADVAMGPMQACGPFKERADCKQVSFSQFDSRGFMVVPRGDHDGALFSVANALDHMGGVMLTLTIFVSRDEPAQEQPA